MRRLIIFVGGELAVLFFGYWSAAVFGVPLALPGIAGSALVIGATLAWPRYRSVTYLGLGLIALLSIVVSGFAVFLTLACLQGGCM
jgi:hypothetical protein